MADSQLEFHWVPDPGFLIQGFLIPCLHRICLNIGSSHFDLRYMSRQPSGRRTPPSFLHSIMEGRLSATTLPATRGCPICFWRRLNIHNGQAPDDQECATCDSEVPAILSLLHTFPGEDWTNIIDTNILGLAEPPVRRATGNRLFVRIPLRVRREHEDIKYVADDPRGGGYVFEGRRMGPFQTVTVFHGTRLSSLVRPTLDWTGRALGQGILHQQRLVYGICEHDGKAGCNFHTDGCWTFDGHTGWVQLECDVTCTTKLGGSKGRYCICGPRNEICFKAILRALWVPYDEIPPMVFLTA